MKKNTTLIILAGGKSSRMGFPKGLLKYNNNFWILSQIEKFIGEEICIGLGFDSQSYFNDIPWLEKAVEKPILYNDKKIKVVLNPTPEFGLFSNLQSVLGEIKTNQQVIVLPIDVPLLNAKGQEKLINDNHAISIPSYKSKKGHPIKLTPIFWKSLLDIDVTNVNSRLDFQIKNRNTSEISLIDINDASILKNLNTPKDWHEFTSI